MTQLTNKVVWITGASSGIGEALARHAAARGAKLVLSSRRASELERVRSALPRAQDVAVLPVDLSRLHDAEALPAQAAAFFGPMSVNALGPNGQPYGNSDGDIDGGMDPAVCAEKIWRAVENNREEALIAGKERVAVYFKRFLPLRWYTAFARRLKVH